MTTPTASSSIAITAASVALNTSILASTAAVSMEPKTMEDDKSPMFLQTKVAQIIAGVFVWVALFLTCQQVRTNSAFVKNI